MESCIADEGAIIEACTLLKRLFQDEKKGRQLQEADIANVRHKKL